MPPTVVPEMNAILAAGGVNASLFQSFLQGHAPQQGGAGDDAVVMILDEFFQLLITEFHLSGRQVAMLGLDMSDGTDDPLAGFQLSQSLRLADA